MQVSKILDLMTNKADPGGPTTSTSSTTSSDHKDENIIGAFKLSV